MYNLTEKISKYKMSKIHHFRWFNSKAAALVMIWGLLTAFADRILHQVLMVLDAGERESFVISGTASSILIVAPLFGWLADAKLGNYRVMKIGVTTSFIASVLVNLLTLLSGYNTSLSSSQNKVVKTILLVVISLLYWSGTISIAVNSFQLGLEQIPDASSDIITSLILWFVLSAITGIWVGDTIYKLLLACTPYSHSSIYQVLALIAVMCLTVNTTSFYLLSPKWFIMEPKSPQSLKDIYRVLKFAVKHKAPLNRSALTYWEEDIPSRLDLGKSRYGGPFTTEQVEDVKTFFKILAVSVGIFLITFATGVHEHNYYSIKLFNITDFSECQANSLFLFTFHPAWSGILAVVVYEFLVYPCLNLRLPSIMKRIGIVSFFVMLQKITFLVQSILVYLNIVEKEAPWILGINSALHGVLTVMLMIVTLEFVCAQAPYNKRGLLSGYMQLTFWVAFNTGNTFSDKFNELCQISSCSLIQTSIGVVVGIVSFSLYLMIAHWYKKRVRDDIDTPHKWVEDVYDRYLSAVNH